MRLKDHKRLVSSCIVLIRRAKALGICDKTNRIYPVDYKVTDPALLQERDNYFLDTLGQIVAIAQYKGGYGEFVQECTALARSVYCGRVKLVK